MKITIPNFNDTQSAFRYKTNKELSITYWVFNLFNYPKLMHGLMHLTTFILKYHLPGKWLIKQSIFKVFCGGENLNQAFITINQLNAYKVKSVLDYVSESEVNDAGYEANFLRIKENIIRLAKGYKNHYISIKLTGLESYEFLKHMSTTHVVKSKSDEERLKRLYTKVDELCRVATEQHIQLFFDAEERCTQDIYDYLVEEMMRTYNKKEVIVYNTLQLYLTDRIAYLKHLIAYCETHHVKAGIKLVRGAYHEKENERAKALGVESPIHLNKAATDEAFNLAITICLNNYHQVKLCVASHNEQSVKHTLNEVQRLGIQNPTQVLSFSQLLGMSDQLTFTLAQAGYETSKYIPYGEVEKAVPYLIRRAQENKSVNGQVNRELSLLKKEINRRNDYL